MAKAFVIIIIVIFQSNVFMFTVAAAKQELVRVIVVLSQEIVVDLER